MADWIASQVLKPLAVEVDTGFAIKVLNEAVDSITLCARSLQSEDLEEIFGGRTVFENILQYEEGHYPLDEMRQAATYLLVNQIIARAMFAPTHVDEAIASVFWTNVESKIGLFCNYANSAIQLHKKRRQDLLA